MLICMPYHVCTLKDKEEVKYFKNLLFGVLQKCTEVSYDMQIHLAAFFIFISRWKINFTLLIKAESLNCENW